MRIQQVRRVDGVREGCVPGAGATPVLRTYRVGSAALVAPAPGAVHIQKISTQIPDASAPDTRRIIPASFADFQHIRNRHARDLKFIGQET